MRSNLEQTRRRVGDLVIGRQLFRFYDANNYRPPMLRVAYGRPACVAGALPGPERLGQLYFEFTVPPDWLETVDAHGLAVLDAGVIEVGREALCLQAKPAKRPGCDVEGAWDVVLATQGAGCRLSRRNARAVRHAGLLRWAPSIKQAHERILAEYREALLPGEPEHAYPCEKCGAAAGWSWHTIGAARRLVCRVCSAPITKDGRDAG